MKTEKSKQSIFNLPRNIWAVSLTSFFMDISSEMVINIIPLFLANVLGVRVSLNFFPAGYPINYAPVNGWQLWVTAYPPFPNPSFILPIPGKP